MSTNLTAPAAEQQPDFTQAEMAETVAAAKAQGNAEGLKAGAEGERSRFTALAELDGGSKISAELSAAIEAGTSAGDFAIGLAKAARAQGANALADAKADALAPADLPQGGAAAAAKPGNEPVNRGKAFAEKKAAAKAK